MILHITHFKDEKLEACQRILQQNNHLITDTEYLSIEMNKNSIIKKCITKISTGDLIIIDGIELLGNSLYTALKNMVAINNKGAGIYLINENLTFSVDNELFNILYKFLGFERYCLEQRAKVAKKTCKDKGIKRGRKEGKTGKSIFDQYKSKIKKYHKLGLSKTKIVENIGVGTPQALGNYIKKIEESDKLKKKTKKEGTLLPKMI